MCADYLTDLVVRRDAHGKRGRVFRTAAPLDVVVDGERFRAPADMATDLASVPRLFRAAFDRLGPMLEASVIHDAAYRGQLLVRAEWGNRRYSITAHMTRAQADRMFHLLLLAAGVGRLRAWLLHRAVRLGGRRAWRSE